MRYFVDEPRRMVRTTDDHDPRPPTRWVEVSSEEYDAFRKETLTFSPKKLKQLRTENA
jgi:hypothetical protein